MRDGINRAYPGGAAIAPCAEGSARGDSTTVLCRMGAVRAEVPCTVLQPRWEATYQEATQAELLTEEGTTVLFVTVRQGC